MQTLHPAPVTPPKADVVGYGLLAAGVASVVLMGIGIFFTQGLLLPALGFAGYNVSSWVLLWRMKP